MEQRELEEEEEIIIRKSFIRITLDTLDVETAQIKEDEEQKREEEKIELLNKLKDLREELQKLEEDKETEIEDLIEEIVNEKYQEIEARHIKKNANTDLRLPEDEKKADQVEEKSFNLGEEMTGNMLQNVILNQSETSFVVEGKLEEAADRAEQESQEAEELERINKKFEAKKRAKVEEIKSKYKEQKERIVESIRQLNLNKDERGSYNSSLSNSSSI